MSRTRTAPVESAPSPTLPLGPRVEAILEVAYRARRPVLLEGPTGIGKSELVGHVARRLGLEHVVLDLSLLEPPDLVGLPVIADGRTRYALPSFLPKAGKGILMLEELNRAERYIQQPALQLLTARRLHEYVLPEGWTCVAAINPETGDYQVTPLDTALRARFLHVPVRADRASWLAWASSHQVHPAVLSTARAHERVFSEVPPRSWTYASDVLHAMRPEERAQTALVRDVLAGYLPPIWLEALLSTGSLSARAAEIDAPAFLRDYIAKGPHAEQLAGWKQRGETDRIDELRAQLSTLLRGPECGVLAAKKELTLASLEALLADLPGDAREQLEEAFSSNPTACVLLDVKPEEVVTNYGGSAAMKRVDAWKADPAKRVRMALLVTAVCAHVAQAHVQAELRRSNAQRMSLGHFLLQLGERYGMPLIETLQRLGVTPIRPT